MPIMHFVINSQRLIMVPVLVDDIEQQRSICYFSIALHANESAVLTLVEQFSPVATSLGMVAVPLTSKPNARAWRRVIPLLF